MQSSEDVIKTHLDAYNARDLNKFAACYAPEIVILDGQGNQIIKGLEVLRGFYGKLFDQSPELHVNVNTTKRIVVGQIVIDEESISGINFEGLPKEGRWAMVNRVANGKIDYCQFFGPESP